MQVEILNKSQVTSRLWVGFVGNQPAYREKIEQTNHAKNQLNIQIGER